MPEDFYLIDITRKNFYNINDTVVLKLLNNEVQVWVHILIAKKL